MYRVKSIRPGFAMCLAHVFCWFCVEKLLRCFTWPELAKVHLCQLNANVWDSSTGIICLYYSKLNQTKAASLWDSESSQRFWFKSTQSSYGIHMCSDVNGLQQRHWCIHVNNLYLQHNLWHNLKLRPLAFLASLLRAVLHEQHCTSTACVSHCGTPWW